MQFSQIYVFDLIKATRVDSAKSMIDNGS